MNKLTISIRYQHMKESVSTTDDIILDDLLQQLAGRGKLPDASNWVVSKVDGDAEVALDLGKSLAENGVIDGDILDLGLVTKGGAAAGT